MKAIRTPLIASLLLTILISLSVLPLQSARAAVRLPMYPANSIGFVDQYNLLSSRVVVSGNYLYSGYTHFAIADISNPDQIKILDRLYNTHYIYDFIVDGQYVYTGMQDFGVYNLDILVNTISEFTPVNLKSSVTGLSLSDGILYAANGYKGVLLLDTKLPADLTPWGEGIKAPGNSVGVTAVGRTVLIASGYDGVRIYDTSDVYKPVELSVINTPGFVNAITIEKNYAYVADGFGGVRILDISDAKKPVEIGFYDTPGTVKRIVVRDTYAYVADGENGLLILDVSNPQKPVELASYHPDGTVDDIALKDNLIFAANMPNGIKVLSWIPPVVKTGLEQGGALVSSADQVTYTLPAGVVGAGTAVTHQPLYPSAVPEVDNTHVKIGPFFSLYGKTAQSAEADLAGTVKVSVKYDPAQVTLNRDAALGLYTWDGYTWVLLPDSKVDVQAKMITGSVSQVGLYGVILNRSMPVKK